MMLSPFVQKAIAWALIHSLWQIALLGLGLMLILSFTRKAKAAIRYQVCLLTLLAAALTLPITFALRLEFPKTTEGLRYESSGLNDSSTESHEAPQARSTPLPSALEPGAAERFQAASQKPADLVRTSGSNASDSIAPELRAIVLAWLLGVIAFSLRPALGWMFGRRLRRRSKELDDIEILQTSKSLCTRLGIRVPSLGVCEQIDVPMVIGFLRPWVIFPIATLSALSPREVESILCHELAHLSRYDHWINLAQCFVESILFYHPVMWWISFQLRAEREAACDERVLNVLPDRKLYCRALMRLEENRGPRPSLGLAADGGSLKQRVERMLKKNRDPKRSPLALGFILSALAWSLMTAGAHTHSEPTESSTAPLSQEELRELNESCYAKHREALRAQYKGQWILIAQGQWKGPFESFEQTSAAADELAPDDDHRFLFRPGVDDLEGEFVQSPWMNSNPSWYQLGGKFRQKFPLMITPSQWIRKSKVHNLAPSGRGSLALQAPGTSSTEVGDPAPPRTQVSAVISSLFDGELTLTQNDVDSLGLSRFSVPGQMKCLSPKRVCRKVHVQYAIQDLDIRDRAVAYVFENTPAIEDKFIIQGKVLHEDGSPVEGAHVKVMTGMASLFQTAEAHTDAKGSYRLKFLPSMGQGAATVFVSKEGLVETELCRAGNLYIGFSGQDFPLIKGIPYSLDFTMREAARIEGYVIDEQGRPIVGRSLAITGEKLPPSSNVLDTTRTDDRGYFAFDAVLDQTPWKFTLSLPQVKGKLESTEFKMTLGQSRKVVIECAPKTSPSTQPQLRLEELDDEREKAILIHAFRILTSREIRGKPHDSSLDFLSFGAIQDGLQAALRIKSEQESFRPGEMIPIEFVIRNVGDEVRVFSSSTWREEDRLSLREVEGSRAQHAQSWYSGIPIMARIELRPGEYAVIESGAMGVTQSAGPDLPHPVVYSLQIGPGEFRGNFKLRFPDIRTAERDDDAQWKGSLRTGDFHLTIKG